MFSNLELFGDRSAAVVRTVRSLFEFSDQKSMRIVRFLNSQKARNVLDPESGFQTIAATKGTLRRQANPSKLS